MKPFIKPIGLVSLLFAGLLTGCGTAGYNINENDDGYNVNQYNDRNGINGNGSIYDNRYNLNEYNGGPTINPYTDTNVADRQKRGKSHE